MSDIVRIENNKRSSRVVSYNGIVWVGGLTAGDSSQDIQGQTRQVPAKIDAYLAKAGNSVNAVKTQIWCAVSTYVLIAIVRRSFNSMPLSIRCYRFFRSQFSRKPSFHAPCSSIQCFQKCPSALTN